MLFLFSIIPTKTLPYGDKCYINEKAANHLDLLLLLFNIIEFSVSFYFAFSIAEYFR